MKDSMDDEDGVLDLVNGRIGLEANSAKVECPDTLLVDGLLGDHNDERSPTLAEQPFGAPPLSLQPGPVVPPGYSAWSFDILSLDIHAHKIWLRFVTHSLCVSTTVGR